MAALAPVYVFRRPSVYRFLPREHVEAFFDDGSLRIPAFQSFRNHADELRLDKNEGKVELVHRTSEGGGQTLIMRVDFGSDAYVLCGSMAPSRDLMTHFRCDSAIVIEDTHRFGECIARHIPQLKAALEGPCSYVAHRMLVKDLGWQNLGPQVETSDPEEFDMEIVERVKASFAQEHAMFLKPHALRDHVEYRFVWTSAAEMRPYLELKVPEAREFCTPWHEHAEIVAF